MSYRVESELFFEACRFAEMVLADKNRLLEDSDGEQVCRSELCDARDALQALLQQTISLHEYCSSLYSDEAEKVAVVRIEQLEDKLRKARTQTNRSNRKVKHLKRKLTSMEVRYDQMCERIIEMEQMEEEDCIDFASYPPYPGIEFLSSDEWGETQEMPQDSSHLWKYELLEKERSVSGLD